MRLTQSLQQHVLQTQIHLPGLSLGALVKWLQRCYKSASRATLETPSTWTLPGQQTLSDTEPRQPAHRTQSCSLRNKVPNKESLIRTKSAPRPRAHCLPTTALSQARCAVGLKCRNTAREQIYSSRKSFGIKTLSSSKSQF